MSRLHDMKTKKQGRDRYPWQKEPAGDIDFSKNPMEEFEQQLKKKYGR